MSVEMKRVLTMRNAVLFVAGLLLLTSSVAVQAGPKYEKVAGHSFIGVVMQELNEDIVKGLDLNTMNGVLISEVVEDSPAEEAGIEDGDVIIEFDGMKVKNPQALKKMVLKTDVGEKVKIKLIRDNKSKVVALIVGEQPKYAEYKFESPGEKEHKEFVFKVPGDLKNIHKNVLYHFDPSRKLGVKVTEIDDDLGSYFDIEEGEGVLVLGIEDDSVAEEVGIKTGDVILMIDGDDIDSIDELKSEIKDVDAGEEFDIVILRHGKKKTLQAVFEDDEDEDIHMFHWNEKDEHMEMPMKFKAEKYKFDENELQQLREEMKKLKVEKYKFDENELQQLREEMKKLKIEMKKMMKELRKELKEELDED